MTDDDYDDNAPNTLRDHVRQHWYTLMPRLYVDENSSVDELLWQQILEQRAHRLLLIWVGIVVPLVILALVLAAVSIGLALIP